MQAFMHLETQDVRCCTALSELVYRAAECADEAAFRQVQQRVEEELGARLSDVRCHKSGGQRYLVGESDAAVYVAFQGTKSATDWLANLNFFHGHFGCGHHAAASSQTSARAHVGFLRRANSTALSISALHAAAAAAGKRLVLTGHSLGGAVAALTTVRLLRALSGGRRSSNGGSGAAAAGRGAALFNDAAEPRIRCISFATPAVANTDLLQEVTAAGWDRFITNIILPEDPVVPFVNLLLKAPASPASSHHSSRRSLFSSDASASSASASASDGGGDASQLTRSDSGESQLSLDSGASWAERLQYQPMELPAADLGAGLAAAGSAAAAALQPLQVQLQAVAGAWLNRPAPPTLAMATADVAGAAGGGGGGSQELASWLMAAQGAVQQRQAYRASHHRAGSLGGSSSQLHSSSGSSLCSLQSDAAWAPAGDGAGAGQLPSQLEASLFAATAAACNWAAAGAEGERIDGAAPPPGSHPLRGRRRSASGGGGAAPAGAAGQQQARGPLGAHVLRQVKRLQHQLGLAKASRLAWISGAVAAGVRCAAALTAPQLLGAPQLSLLAVLPRALAGPAALAALHMLGHAAYQAALPASHPLGQQWVMTGNGMELVARPLSDYPRNTDGLGLQELGGFFPGHRMIAYRRRLATLVGRAPQLQQH